MWIWLGLLLFADQMSKRLLYSFATAPLVQNTGMAFGFLSHNTPLIIALNIFLLLLLIVYRKRWFDRSVFQRWAFVFILAGGLGNLADRLLLGFVIDFIHFPGIPVFNFADVYINIAVLLLVLHVLKRAPNHGC